MLPMRANLYTVSGPWSWPSNSVKGQPSFEITKSVLIAARDKIGGLFHLKLIQQLGVQITDKLVFIRLVLGSAHRRAGIKYHIWAAHTMQVQRGLSTECIQMLTTCEPCVYDEVLLILCHTLIGNILATFPQC